MLDRQFDKAHSNLGLTFYSFKEEKMQVEKLYPPPL